MHELGADAAAINSACGVGYVARQIKVGMGQRSEMPNGIEVGLQVAPAAEGVHDALQLFAVNVNQ